MSATAEAFNRRHLMASGHAVITATDDSGGIHKAQIKATSRELIDDVPVVQIYGFSGHAPVGSEAHLVCVAGDRSKSVVVATNNPDARLRGLKAGEVAVYDNKGTTIILKTDGSVEITCSGRVRMNTPRLEVSGDVIAGADGVAISLLHHKHRDVQPGGGNTGVPVP